MEKLATELWDWRGNSEEVSSSVRISLPLMYGLRYYAKIHFLDGYGSNPWWPLLVCSADVHLITAVFHIPLKPTPRAPFPHALPLLIELVRGAFWSVLQRERNSLLLILWWRSDCKDGHWYVQPGQVKLGGVKNMLCYGPPGFSLEFPYGFYRWQTFWLPWWKEACP